MEAVKGKTEGSSEKTEDVQGGEREEPLCHRPAETSEARKDRTCISVQVGCVEVVIDILNRMNKGCTSAQTKRKARSTERANGRVCWVVEKGDRSKEQRKRSKDGWVKIA